MAFESVRDENMGTRELDCEESGAVLAVHTRAGLADGVVARETGGTGGAGGGWAETCCGRRRKDEEHENPRTWLGVLPHPSSHLHTVRATLADTTVHSRRQGYDGGSWARCRTRTIPSFPRTSRLWTPCNGEKAGKAWRVREGAMGYGEETLTGRRGDRSSLNPGLFVDLPL